MRAADLRAYLASGPKTWAEICEETGLSENRAMVEVKRLEYEGCSVDYQHVTVITLVNDPARPTLRWCEWPGCTTALHHRNGTGFCGVHVQQAATARWFALPEDQRRTLADEITGDASSCLSLFDSQLSLEEVMVGA